MKVSAILVLAILGLFLISCGGSLIDKETATSVPSYPSYDLRILQETSYQPETVVPIGRSGYGINVPESDGIVTIEITTNISYREGSLLLRYGIEAVSSEDCKLVKLDPPGMSSLAGPGLDVRSPNWQVTCPTGLLKGIRVKNYEKPSQDLKDKIEQLERDYGLSLWGCEVYGFKILESKGIPCTTYYSLQAEQKDISVMLKGPQTESDIRKALILQFTNSETSIPTSTPAPISKPTPTKPVSSPTATLTPKPYPTSTAARATAIPTPIVPSAGLISWWSAESTTQDKVGSNNGTRIGTLTYAPGVAGQAFKLDGATAYIRVEDAPSLDLGDESFTIAAWINPSVVGGGAYYWVIDKSRGNSNLDFGFGLHTDGRLRVTSRNVAIDFSSPLPVTANVFTHIVVVQDAGLGLIRLYVNGDMVASARVAGVAVTNDAPVVIGGRQTETDVKHFFKGLIDEVLIFDRAISSEETRTLGQRIT